jgi:hypothetical protein
MNVTVEARMLGQRKPLVPDWHVALPTDLDESPTLRALIETIVRAEVEAFNERQEQRRLTHVLTPQQIQEGLSRGKVDMGGRESAEPAEVEASIAVALQAFEDGLYFVFVDDVQYSKLDDVIPLRAASRMLFLRLVALAGG